MHLSTHQANATDSRRACCLGAAACASGRVTGVVSVGATHGGKKYASAGGKPEMFGGRDAAVIRPQSMDSFRCIQETAT